jgi:hypothetical protein
MRHGIVHGSKTRYEPAANIGAVYAFHRSPGMRMTGVTDPRLLPHNPQIED